MILQVAKRIANIRLTLVRQTLKRFDYPLILSAFFTLANQLAGYPYKIQTSLLQKYFTLSDCCKTASLFSES